MALKILNWNIEQFGDTRSSHSSRVKTVVEVINAIDPDIVALIEVKTTNPGLAIRIARLLCDRLQSDHNKHYSFNVSHHNLLEVYVFLYKYDRVSPYVIPKATRSLYNRQQLSQLSLVMARDYRDYSRYNATTAELSFAIPLLDFPNRFNNDRPPCVGLFYDHHNDTNTAVIAWHNMATTWWAQACMRDLATANYITNGFSVREKNKPNFTINEVVVTGDFNVDFNTYPGDYTCFNNYATIIADDTFLMPWDPNNDGTFNNTTEIREHCFDNFIVATNRQTAGAVSDFPDMLMNNTNTRNYLINNSYLVNQAGLIAEVRELVLKELNKVTSYFPDNVWATMRNQVRNARINNRQVVQSDLAALQRNLRTQDYNKVVNYFNGQLNAAHVIYTHFTRVVNGLDQFDINDSLFLTRTIISDHLPVTLTLS